MNFERFRGSILTPTFLGTLGGYLYSLLLTLTSARFLHYLPVPSVLRSLFIALLIGSFTGIATLVARRIDGRILFAPLLLLAAHFSLWTLVTVPRIGEGKILATVLVLGGILLLIFGGLPFLTLRWSLPTTLSVFLIPLLLCVVAQFFLLRSLAVGTIDRHLRYSPEETLYAPVDRRAALLDPFSLPLEDALDAYPFLLPEVPEGEKILVLVLDAFREDFFAREQNGVQLTPYMKKLAEKNFYFSNYRVQAAWTKASTASLFTGQYVREHGTFLGGGGDLKRKQANDSDDSDPYWGHALPERKFTLAERLKRKGFDTFGLVEIEHISSRYQFDQGFDQYLSYSGAFRNHPNYLIRRLLFWFLRIQPEKAFAYVHLKGPHYPYPLAYPLRNENVRFWAQTPYFEDGSLSSPDWNLPSHNVVDLTQETLPEDFDENIDEETTFLRHLYGAELNAYDRYVLPRYEKTLRQLGVWEETNQVITSDHGEGIYDHDRYFGHGYNLYEEAIHVPLVFKPSSDLLPRNQRGRTLDANVESIDLTATLLEEAGASRRKVSGHSFLPALRSRENYADSPAFSEKPRMKRITSVALTEPPWKYIYNLRNSTGELYQLEEDPGEQNPVRDRPDLEASFQSAIRERWPRGGTIPRRAPLKKIGAKARETLKGLGYF